MPATQDDLAFLADFEACRISQAEWTHAAHIRMAWLYLHLYGYPDALGRIREGIQRLNRAFGNTTGYHETVTVAYARLVAAAHDPQQTYEQFRDDNAALYDRANPPTLRHYSRERIMSAEARAGFVEPDLTPLPRGD